MLSYTRLHAFVLLGFLSSPFPNSSFPCVLRCCVADRYVLATVAAAGAVVAGSRLANNTVMQGASTKERQHQRQSKNRKADTARRPRQRYVWRHLVSKYM